ncbi:MAG: hypothetical protein ACRDDY_13345 [Clostridium sp.]|uniref:hypothetical protein n=1 Tax=Clostridium sp. TaxID=1506 RepID=UPI003EE4F9C2
MFIVWSKETGKIKSIATGGNYREIKDLYPRDYLDYEKIYDCGNIEDNLCLKNNYRLYKIIDGKIVLDEDEVDKLKKLKP